MYKFVQKWGDDLNKKAFRKMEVVSKDWPPNVYSLWEGHDIEKKKIASETGDIHPFLYLLWDMSGGEETVREYLLKWIAFLFQNSEKKPKTALVFQSKRGSGKNKFGGIRRTWKRPTPRGIFLKSAVWHFKDIRLLVLVKQEERLLFWSKFVINICRTLRTTNRFGRTGFVCRMKSRTTSPIMSSWWV